MHQLKTYRKEIRSVSELQKTVTVLAGVINPLEYLTFGLHFTNETKPLHSWHA